MAKAEAIADYSIVARGRRDVSSPRVLRVIGRLPTPEETRSYLEDGDGEKKAKLIDRLLERPEYADFWANKVGGSLAPQSLPRRDQGGVDARRLAAAGVSREHAVRSIRTRTRDRAG